MKLHVLLNTVDYIEKEVELKKSNRVSSGGVGFDKQDRICKNVDLFIDIIVKIRIFTKVQTPALITSPGQL